MNTAILLVCDLPEFLVPNIERLQPLVGVLFFSVLVMKILSPLVMIHFPPSACYLILSQYERYFLTVRQKAVE